MKENIAIAGLLILVFGIGVFCGQYNEKDCECEFYKDIANSCVNNYEICINDFNDAVSIAEECVELQKMLVLTTWRLCKEEVCGE